MEMEILLPEEVAVMTLPEVTFFPQALLPLHIFEPRYRTMLADILASHRMFAVAGMDPAGIGTGTFEPPHRIATVGMIRACQENDNGTSNLLIQGLVRVEVLEILREEPYRCIRVRPLESAPGAEPDENERLRARLARLLTTQNRLHGHTGEKLTKFLHTIEDPETFVDLAAFSLCDDTRMKQRLLETLDVNARLRLYSKHVEADISSLKLQKTLQGNLDDSDIPRN